MQSMKLLTAALLLSSPAFAQEGNPEGFYLGVGLGDFSADILPASRRLSVFGSFPPGEPGFPTVRSFPGEPFEAGAVSRRASSRGGLSQFLRPKAPVSPDSGKVGSA